MEGKERGKRGSEVTRQACHVFLSVGIRWNTPVQGEKQLGRRCVVLQVTQVQQYHLGDTSRASWPWSSGSRGIEPEI
jgi:hypothetical protein